NSFHVNQSQITYIPSDDLMFSPRGGYGFAGEVRPLYDFLTHLEVYWLYPDRLRHPQTVHASDRMERFGENFAGVLHNILETSDWQRDLFRAFARIVPGVDERQAIKTYKQQGDTVFTYVRHDGGVQLPLSNESDGTIRALGLLAAIYQKPPLSFMGIE